MSARPQMGRDKKKAETFLFRLFKKNWRQPTLAESIKPLPSARLCLTAVFGMGTGRATALWSPKNLIERPATVRPPLERVGPVGRLLKRAFPWGEWFSENYTQG